MSFKNLPVMLSLLAGFVVCVVTFIYRYEGTSWLWLVLGALVLFYGLGLCLRKLFSVVLSVKEPEDEENMENEKKDAEKEAEDNGEK